jgi:phosphatidate phosphatase APP1
VLVAGDDPPLVVVSDLDDTVIQTGVGSVLQMARGILLQSARTRLPFPGVAGFYRALHTGVPAERSGAVPILYLSSSPWNLYDLLEQFFQLRGIPLGPILLRDWGLSRESLFAASHHQHKLGHLLDLLAFFPRSRFLLIGDSGQHDPEIYREAAQRHPGRVAGVYIRDVSPLDARDQAIRATQRELAEVGADLVLAADTVTMAEHAASRGWIAPDAVAAVAAERADER